MNGVILIRDQMQLTLSITCEMISIGAQLAELIMFMVIEIYFVAVLPWKNLARKALELGRGVLRRI